MLLIPPIGTTRTKVSRLIQNAAAYLIAEDWAVTKNCRDTISVVVLIAKHEIKVSW